MDAAKPSDLSHELILVPIASGTGYVASDGTILSDDKHIKHNFLAFVTFAEYAILDYSLMVNMPQKLTAGTGLDAMAHACEAMTGTLNIPYMELVGQQVIRDIVKYFPRTVADRQDMETREKMAIASIVAGFMLTYGHVVGGHPIPQRMGGYFDIPHVPAWCYTLPWIMEYNAIGTPLLVQMFGEAMVLSFASDATDAQVGTQIHEFLVNFVKNQCKMPKLKGFISD